METFLEWFEQHLSEGRPAGYQPSAQIGVDPTVSALEKISRAAEQGIDPFAGGFMDSDVLFLKLGLQPGEIERVQQLGLVVRDPQRGTVINQPKFARIYQQLRNMPPSVQYRDRSQRIQPPPMPQRRAV